MARIKRVLTIANLNTTRITRWQLTPAFYQAFGNPQNRGVWFVWGNSASGKSSFNMQLAKEFARHTKVLYNLLEEDPDDAEYIDRTKMFSMHEVARNFHTAQFTYDELIQYLDKSKRHKVIFIDSITYFNIDFDKYLALKKRFRNRTFVIVGHATGKRPRTKLEEDIMYDARMKIYVEGYAAYCKGRTIGPNGGIYIIWNEGYQKLQGQQIKQI